jgi:hypothetical protein
VIIFMLRSWSAGPSATVEKSAPMARSRPKSAAITKLEQDFHAT